LKYEHLTYNAVDMQLVEQLKMTGIDVCTCYHVTPYLVDIGPPPPYANIEPVIQKYYSQCLQVHFNGMELGARRRPRPRQAIPAMRMGPSSIRTI
jgi:hypothetical protein